MSMQSSEPYNTGYSDGQNARREYSRRLCHEMGLVDPPISAKSDAREGMVPAAELRPTIELLLGATCRLGFTNPETQEGKDLWALRAKLHQEATRLETLLKTHAKE